MSNRQTKILKNSAGEVVGYKITSKNGEFTIPVLDNRNPKHKERIARTLKEVNALRGSKFMKPSFSAWGFSYNVSREK